jgi:NAD(P)-dependent dehydrogenase (short-subunit alcohol dehydrogenase family)/acyl carrier protein
VPSSRGPAAPRLANGGVYWITGASGAIGCALAEHLAARYHARLLLTARRGIPAEMIASLESKGAVVLAVAADASNPVQMSAARDAALARFGRIDGIVHAAGIAGGGLIAGGARESIARTLAPKVDGTLVLADLAKDAAVRFIVVCSSLAAVHGGLGQVDYVAANAFLDAFAGWHTRQSGIFTTSIAWDAWLERGMAVDVAAALGRRAPAAGLSAAQGVEAFERVLAANRTHVLVSSAPIDERFAASASQTRRSAIPGDGMSVESQIGAVWHQVLGADGIGPADNFFDVGGDSLKGVQLVALVNERFGIDVPIAQFFAAPTVAGLAALVRDRAEPLQPPAAAIDPASERGRRRSARHRARVAS